MFKVGQKTLHTSLRIAHNTAFWLGLKTFTDLRTNIVHEVGYKLLKNWN